MTHYRFIIFAFLWVGIIPNSAFGEEDSPPPGWIHATTNVEAPYYRGAGPSTGVMGYFTRGAEIVISPVAQDDYLKVFFSAPINGRQYGYVPASAVDVDPSLLILSSKAKSFEPDFEGKYHYYFVFEGLLGRINPAGVQAQLGESPYYFLNVNYLAEFGLNLFSVIDLSFQLRSNSLEHSVQGYSKSVNYFLDGFSTLFGLQLHVFRIGAFAFLVGGGAGFSFNSAGNNSQYFQMKTEGLMGYPLYGQARFQYLFGKFGINADVGYMDHKVINVPILTLPGGNTETSASFDMSGPYAALGVNLHF